MAQAKSGDTVRVHYTGTLKDGTIFDSSRERDPLEIALGQNQVIPGFEKAVVGMSPGETCKTTIPCDEAYGPRRDGLVITVDRKQVPSEIQPEVGQHLTVTKDTGEDVPVVVSEVSDETVTLDANHPLAGKDLTFEIELVEVKAAS